VELEAVETARRDFTPHPLRLLPAAAREPRGLPALRRLARALVSPAKGVELLRSTEGTQGSAKDEPPGSGSFSPPWWLALLAPPRRDLLLVGGKGGVGKTTCAAAVAVAAAAARPQRQVLLLSADPAHSLGDVLLAELGDDERPVSGAPANLLCREIDPGRALARWRERFGEATGEVLAALTGLPATTAERATADLLGLEPPGLDELAALDALADAFPAPPARPVASLVVVDTAPTGHALRLLAMPELALAWDHALLALLLKYREAVAPGELAAELVALSRSLKRIAALLADPERTAFAVVTRPAELPRRESLRLLDALRAARIAPAAVLVNAAPEPAPLLSSSLLQPSPSQGGGTLRPPPAEVPSRGETTFPACPRCSAEAAAASRQISRFARDLAGREGCAMILAPAAVPPPRGPESLAAWSRSWREGPT
jgi:arsenite-transporting ATPase